METVSTEEPPSPVPSSSTNGNNPSFAFEDMIGVNSNPDTDTEPISSPQEASADSTEEQISQLSSAQRSTYDTLLTMGFDTKDTLVVARVFGANVEAATDAILNGTVDSLRDQSNSLSTLRQRHLQREEQQRTMFDRGSADHVASYSDYMFQSGTPFRVTALSKVFMNGYYRLESDSVYIMPDDVQTLIIRYFNIYFLRLRYNIDDDDANSINKALESPTSCHSDGDEKYDGMDAEDDEEDIDDKAPWKLSILKLDQNVSLRTVAKYLEENGPFKYKKPDRDPSNNYYSPFNNPYSTQNRNVYSDVVHLWVPFTYLESIYPLPEGKQIQVTMEKIKSLESRFKQDPFRWVEVPCDFEDVSILHLDRIVASKSKDSQLEIAVELYDPDDGVWPFKTQNRPLPFRLHSLIDEEKEKDLEWDQVNSLEDCTHRHVVILANAIMTGQYSNIDGISPPLQSNLKTQCDEWIENKYYIGVNPIQIEQLISFLKIKKVNGDRLKHHFDGNSFGKEVTSLYGKDQNDGVGEAATLLYQSLMMLESVTKTEDANKHIPEQQPNTVECNGHIEQEEWRSDLKVGSNLEVHDRSMCQWHIGTVREIGTDENDHEGEIKVHYHKYDVWLELESPCLAMMGTHLLKEALTAGMLFGDTIDCEEKRLIRERLFPMVYALEALLAEEITGILLRMDHMELLVLLNDQNALKIKVQEVLARMVKDEQFADSEAVETEYNKLNEDCIEYNFDENCIVTLQHSEGKFLAVDGSSKIYRMHMHPLKSNSKFTKWRLRIDDVDETDGAPIISLKHVDKDKFLRVQKRDQNQGEGSNVKLELSSTVSRYSAFKLQITGTNQAILMSTARGGYVSTDADGTYHISDLLQNSFTIFSFHCELDAQYKACHSAARHVISQWYPDDPITVRYLLQSFVEEEQRDPRRILRYLENEKRMKMKLDALRTFASNLKIGDIIEALDDHGKWYQAVIRYIGNKGHDAKRRLYLHYIGWNHKWDEKIYAHHLSRIARRGTHTKGPHRDRRRDRLTTPNPFYAYPNFERDEAAEPHNTAPMESILSIPEEQQFLLEDTDCYQFTMDDLKPFGEFLEKEVVILTLWSQHLEEDKKGKAVKWGDIMYRSIVEFIRTKHPNAKCPRKSSKRFQKVILEPLEQWLYETQDSSPENEVDLAVFDKLCSDAIVRMQEFCDYEATSKRG